ncbi:colanic acid biosynthesis glycosyltransferase WcaE [Scandinavium sp. M-37]|jgi:putative colanic acid biosynthesis glycosyltransferase|uniref:colanic acid biosynthesis glycosyltransferase WcaE n=1 Tax=Scandinavium sp. M-37 TaxID=3373077 RepID=UPI00374750D7
MLLSVITVSWENNPGLQKTWQSLSYLEKIQDLAFEWIVVDGGSQDGTVEFLESCEGKYNLRYISERDAGVYDAMNKGVEMASGQYVLFLNSGDCFHSEIATFIQQLAVQSTQEKEIYIGDAVLDFGNGVKKMRSAKPGWYIYHSLPASHQSIFYPRAGLVNYPYELQYKISADYALTARMFKCGYNFKHLNGVVSEFAMGGMSTVNNKQLCIDVKNAQLNIMKLPKVMVFLSYWLRVINTSRAKKLYNHSQSAVT